MVCEELKIRCVGLNVGTIKKYTTGKGNATKKETIAFVESCGFNPADDNEADGSAILLTGLDDLKFQKIKGTSCQVGIATAPILF
jgi:Holliday junction resolvasome RuvABC endonuclease subunit